jgi:Family of unknown function (DUF5681)
MPKRKTPQPGEYVGYRHPPKATQFKAGKSGNPKGRPKGSQPVGSMLRDIIQQKVAVTEGGKTRKIPALEVMFRRLANDAMRSDKGAIKFLLSLVDRYSESPEAKIELNEMLAEDEEILARYLPGAPNSCPPPERDDEGGNNGA